jgi:hypothetical protein
MTNENVGDWFEYVWSMTRAIRKDITQQDLKDPITVDLVEKCARFHIVCAERLIEEVSMMGHFIFIKHKDFSALIR